MRTHICLLCNVTAEDLCAAHERNFCKLTVLLVCGICKQCAARRTSHQSQNAWAPVQVNDYLQTTNRSIYAVGDVCTQYHFTHVAGGTLPNCKLPLQPH